MSGEAEALAEVLEAHCACRAESEDRGARVVFECGIVVTERMGDYDAIEAMHTARAALASPWLAAHDAAIRAEALAPVLHVAEVLSHVVLEKQHGLKIAKAIRKAATLATPTPEETP